MHERKRIEFENSLIHSSHVSGLKIPSSLPVWRFNLRLLKEKVRNGLTAFFGLQDVIGGDSVVAMERGELELACLVGDSYVRQTT